jgi:hypothetical protein
MPVFSASLIDYDLLQLPFWVAEDAIFQTASVLQSFGYASSVRLLSLGWADW